MIKYSLAILYLVMLTACGTATYAPDPRISDIEDLINNQSQRSLQLEEKLDTLIGLQVQTMELVHDELANTQVLLDAQNGSIVEPSVQSSTDNVSTMTKSQWLKDEGKVIVGGIETISFTSQDSKIRYAARIDTGATSSSLDARNISRFERDGDSWVRFDLFVDDQHHSSVERPVVRWVRIFQSTTEEGERRPVVNMSYTLGDTEDTAEFTLTDRSHLEFSALIGRNLITDRMIVDVSSNYIFTKK